MPRHTVVCDIVRATIQLTPSPTPICRTSQSTRTRPPAAPARVAGRVKIIPPAKTGTGFERDLSSAISGFRSLAVRGSAAF